MGIPNLTAWLSQPDVTTKTGLKPGVSNPLFLMKIDIKSLLSRDRRRELEAEKGSKEEIVRSVRRYPTDTPKEFDDIGWEEMSDPL